MEELEIAAICSPLDSTESSPLMPDKPTRSLVLADLKPAEDIMDQLAQRSQWDLLHYLAYRAYRMFNRKAVMPEPPPEDKETQ